MALPVLGTTQRYLPKSGFITVLHRISRIPPIGYVIAVEGVQSSGYPFHDGGRGRDIIPVKFGKFKPYLEITMRSNPCIGGNKDEAIVGTTVVFNRVVEDTSSGPTEGTTLTFRPPPNHCLHALQGAHGQMLWGKIIGDGLSRFN